MMRVELYNAYQQTYNMHNGTVHYSCLEMGPISNNNIEIA